jgi:Mn-dependent DtxR family transcriptional regulator
VSDDPSKPALPRTTKAAEDYLERISELIATKGYARAVDIATELGISPASVSAMIQRLDAEGLLKYEKYRGMMLTEAGEAVAQRIAHRHQLLTQFLRTLGVGEAEVAQDVEGMEHHIGPQTFEAIEKLTQFLAANPDVLTQAGLPVGAADEPNG